MDPKKQKFYIVLVFLLMFFVVLFMGSEPRQRSKPGQRYIIDNLLPPIIEDIKKNPAAGRHEKTDYAYTIFDASRVREIFDECVAENESYHDNDNDSYIYVRKIKVAAGEDVLARIEIKRSLNTYFFNFIYSKKIIVLSFLMAIAGIAVYFIFSSYRHAIDAQSENQKYLAVQRMSRGLAHEIRNPLNSMYLSLDLISRHDECSGCGKNDELGECLGIIKSEVRRLDDLVKRFMDYSKDIKLKRSKESLKEIVQSVISVLSPLALEKKAAIKFDGSDVTVDIDHDLIYQSLFNVIKNAVEAVQSGGNIDISYSLQGAAVEIVVADDGAGIKEADLPKIFEFYFSTKNEGSGIGLALARKFIDAHGGNISASCEKNKTRFIIKLPVR